ncbi:hypothetical protein C2W64_03560 [Brevibacillus laterosporus]|nr:hypothetical protein C2W64_03560 [Brevibacillus laterosporus]
MCIPKSYFHPVHVYVALTWDCIDLYEGAITVDKIMVNKEKEWA